jgi:hypothetical protein
MFIGKPDFSDGRKTTERSSERERACPFFSADLDPENPWVVVNSITLPLPYKTIVKNVSHSNFELPVCAGSTRPPALVKRNLREERERQTRRTLASCIIAYNHMEE